MNNAFSLTSTKQSFNRVDVLKRAQQFQNYLDQSALDFVAIRPSLAISDCLNIAALAHLNHPFLLVNKDQFTTGEALKIVEEASGLIGVDINKIQFSEDTEVTASFDIRSKNKNGILCMMFSSGTTSTPKLIPLTNEQWFTAAENTADNYLCNSGEASLLALSPAHMGGLGVILRGLYHNHEVVIAEDGSAESITSALQEFSHIQNISLVGAQLFNLIKSDTSLALIKKPNILLGGGPISTDLRKQIIEHQLNVVFSYGSTESFGQVFNIWANQYPSDKISQNGVGYANDATEIKIQKFDSKERSEFNESGDLFIRGKQVFNGYFGWDNKPGKHILDLDGWFATGDIAYQNEDGFVVIEMRRNDLIVSGGKKINPIELELDLGEKLSPIEFCFVGIEDQKWGQVLVCVYQSDMKQDVKLEKQLKESFKRLEPFQQPKYYVAIKEIARTSIGKIKRNELSRYAKTKING